MLHKHTKKQISCELNNLIDNAVKNAIIRRNHDIDSANDVFDLSEEETQNIIGGLSGSHQGTSTCGMKCPIQF